MSGPARFSWRDFPPAQLAAAKADAVVTVCLPARDEAATVGPIVSAVADLGDLVDELIVVDDRSVDDTAAVAASAGATVVPGPGIGKGAALRTGLDASKGDVVVFCDADIRGFSSTFVTGLLGPLLCGDEIGFVNATYARPGDGGRVTELVARPIISLLFPELAAFGQPLAGEYAGRRELLEVTTFEDGYGVDLGLLIDIVRMVGIEHVAEVDLGERVHRNRPLAELRPQAEAVLAAALARAGLRGPNAVDGLRGPNAVDGLRGPNAGA